MPDSYRHTKIIATLGPATESKEMLAGLILAGVDILRLNMAHASHQWVDDAMWFIREASAEVGRQVGVMMDVKGPEIRTGEVDDPVPLATGDLLEFFVGNGRPTGDVPAVSVNYPGLPADLEIGTTVLVDSGLIRMKVIDKDDTHVRCEVLTPGIIATHLLETMISSPMPTRAEISDVSTAVRQQVDAIMLSGETTIGAYPLEAVQVMKNIIQSTEPTVKLPLNQLMELRDPKTKMLRSAALLARDLGDSGIIVFTRSGFLPYVLGALRPCGVPIYAFTDVESVFRQLLLPWGVEPFLMGFSEDHEETVLSAMAYLKGRDWVKPGQWLAVITNVLAHDEIIDTLQLRHVE